MISATITTSALEIYTHTLSPPGPQSGALSGQYLQNIIIAFLATQVESIAERPNEVHGHITKLRRGANDVNSDCCTPEWEATAIRDD